MRGFGLLLFGGVSSLGVAVSTAILRRVFKRPQCDQYRLTSGNETDDAAEKNVESYFSSEETMDVPGLTAIDSPQAETPLLKMMKDENKTDFTYDSYECARRYGEDYYSDGRSPNSRVLSPDSKASKSTVLTRLFTDDDIGSDDESDEETVSEIVLSDRDEPPSMGMATAPTRGIFATEQNTDPRMAESFITADETFRSATAQSQSSSDGVAEQAQASLAMDAKRMMETPAAEGKIDMPHSRSSSMDGSIEPYLADLVCEGTTLLRTASDTSVGEGASESDEEDEFAEPYMKELLGDDEWLMSYRERKDKMIQTSPAESLSSESTSSKESVIKVHGSAAQAPHRAGAYTSTGSLASGALVMEYAKTGALVRPVSTKRVALDGYTTGLSGPQGFNAAVSKHDVSVVGMPIPKTWPQAEERGLEIGRRGTGVVGVLHNANGEGVGAGEGRKATGGPSVAAGVVQMGGTMKSTALLPSIGGGGKENIVKRKSGLVGRPSGSRADEARGSKRFRFAERIRMLPLRTRSNSSRTNQS